MCAWAFACLLSCPRNRISGDLSGANTLAAEGAEESAAGRKVTLGKCRVPTAWPFHVAVWVGSVAEEQLFGSLSAAPAPRSSFPSRPGAFHLTRFINPPPAAAARILVFERLSWAPLQQDIPPKEIICFENSDLDRTATGIKTIPNFKMTANGSVNDNQWACF